MVGFRYFVESHARALGLTGWVRNGQDGQTVEVVAEGAAEALQRLEEHLRRGPRGARVDSVEIVWAEDVEGFMAFEVRW
jgi:acylphosphatase